MPRLPLALLLACLAAAPAAQAQSTSLPPGSQTQEQTPALLVADQVFITPERQLIAEGNVEAYQGEVRLRAQKITFDRESGTLSIEGPIRIDQGGEITILADAAEMDQGLQNGLLRGARMVFEQQVQLASLQMTRVGGRYTQLYKTAVTSCHVCEDGRPPLWQIRAQKVTHDQAERQLYFEGAQFRVLDVPIFYFPALRLPDPTLKRANGFLVPSIRSTSQLGVGVRVPYFFKLGDHRDLTLTPYLSSKTTTLGFRYRQAFRRGRININGAFTRDDILKGEDRGYLFADGIFALKNGYRLGFDIKTVSDDGYLLDYGLPDYDRLRSQIALERTTRDEAFLGRFIHYKSLRDDEVDDESGAQIFDLDYQRRYFPDRIGGELLLGFEGHAHRIDTEEEVVGRDLARATADVAWDRYWILGQGLRTELHLGTSVDGFKFFDDDVNPDNVLRATPRAALTLRYPMTRQEKNGATQYLEPIAQLGWTNVTNSDVPNEESGFVEFDQGDLLRLSRFPAPDVREDGATFVYGLNWARYDPAGWQAYATIGQVFRQYANPNFTKTSGLQGTSSDILLAGQIRMNNGLALTTRGILSGELNFDKAEVRADWFSDRLNFSSTYLWLGRDPQEDRDMAVSEVWFDGGYQVDPNWRALADLRYDIQDSRAVRTGIGAIYKNECLTINISLSRRYTSSTSVEPSTDFGISLSLDGFAVEGASKEYRRSCRKS
ncbi:LPS-assembly protein LptD [Ruegeria hyattellae]|uniref:LPS-assembly protein LptD n=1 Tax=Ruegeria hyattellae TaxID=3233337 RepID=UPI00355C5965